ncbi:hypothetical protein FH966_02665 [Lentibacillus cibarius]|uniref:ApeA N-terminal domain-containing protein n=1 Tax=Lentibacillus cibarius TaxID=2583219 RepID=A0A549YFN8_9BACI|nr:hypothetical protein [Lentibacillus cibarius]TRM10704.1 hypothetical protein FH966_02665 [Lentibacillus cibarius]
MNNFFTASEWEGMHEKYDIKKLKEMDYLVIDRLLNFEVFRDDDYKIKGKIMAEKTDIAKGDTNYYENHQAGEIVEYTNLTGSNSYGTVTYIIDQCLITARNSQYTNLGENPVEKLVIEFSASQVLKQYHGNKSNTEILIDWYINGPDISFPSSTERQFISTTKRKRSNIDPDYHLVNRQKQNSSSRDCAIVEYNGMKFIVFAVLKDIGPEWSHNIGVEYRREWGIPNETERKAIAEILSFAFGGQLLNVGSTEYDSDYNPLKEISVNPWGKNVVSRCKESKTSPVGFYYTDIAFKMEDILNHLVKKYLALRESLKLNSVLSRYWIAKDMPLGTNLPVLASGLEVLVDSWFKSSISKNKGIHIDKDTYWVMIEDELSSLSLKLDNYPFKEKILNKLKFAYNMGVNEKKEKFFEEINLPININDKKALRARNDMAHGSTIKSEKDIIKTLRSSRTYETLFERTILKILDYDGIYIDKSVKGWPARYMGDTPEEGC